MLAVYFHTIIKVLTKSASNIAKHPRIYSLVLQNILFLSVPKEKLLMDQEI